MKRGRQDQIALAHYKYEERIRVGGPKVRKVHRRLALASLLRLSKRESSRQKKIWPEKACDDRPKIVFTVDANGNAREAMALANKNGESK